MTDHRPDPALDAQLRQLPLPAGLFVRLRGIATLGDEELDYCLRDVPLPAGLVERWKLIVEDEALDERIRDIPLPVEVMVQVRRIASRPRRSRIGQWSLAASLLITIAAGYYGFLAGLLAAVRPGTIPRQTLLTAGGQPLHVTGSLATAVRLASDTADARVASQSDTWTGAETHIALRPFVTSARPGPASRVLAELESWRPCDNWLLLRWGLLGYGHRAPDVPLELEALSLPPARGWEVPLDRGFDRGFLYSRGVHPPVLTAADQSASVLTVPLTTETTSFDLLRRSVAQQRLPEPAEVHVEDLLAAINYQFPAAPSGRLAIRTAAGPAVFNPAADGLLQVAIKAGRPARRTLPATHLTVALDLSASMQWGGRLAAVQQGLAGCAGQLGADDRFSLILCRAEAEPAVEQARREDLHPLLRIFDRLRAQDAANVLLGLQQAVATAVDSPSGNPLAKRLALITASRGALPAAATRKLQPMLTEAAHRGLRLDVLDLQGVEETDPALAALARATGGRVHAVRTAADVRWALTELLYGDASLVATSTRLQVAFNPRSVVAYRLIGHESMFAGGLQSATVAADLHVDEEATALFEVWFYPNAHDEVGAVTLEWREPQRSDAAQRITQRISRLQFVTSFEGSPPWLQAAALAAEAGEILRHGYSFDVPTPGIFTYRPKPRTLQEVTDLARHVHPSLAEQPEFCRFATALRQASRLASDRRNGASKSGMRVLVAGRWRDAKE
jgi:hypothetical protein